jgi:hypothetical protein
MLDAFLFVSLKYFPQCYIVSVHFFLYYFLCTEHYLSCVYMYALWIVYLDDVMN